MTPSTSTSTSKPAPIAPPAPRAEASAPPHLVLKPKSGWQSLDLRVLWRYRDLLLTLAQRDVKLRYRQTALGVVWVVLQPLIAAGIFSFVFGAVAGLSSEGVPYIVFSFAGLLGWNLFFQTVTKASIVMVQNSHLVSKVYFPRLILPFSTILSTLIDFLVALSMMGVLMVVFRVAPTPALLALPVWIALVLMLAMGVGLYTSALMVSYRDVQYVVPVVLQFLLYASPVAYSATTALERLAVRSPEVAEVARVAYLANPLAGLLEAFRWSLLGRGEPPWAAIAYAAAFSILVFVSGAFNFRKMERKFADVI